MEKSKKFRASSSFFLFSRWMRIKFYVIDRPPYPLWHYQSFLFKPIFDEKFVPPIQFTSRLSLGARRWAIYVKPYLSKILYCLSYICTITLFSIYLYSIFYTIRYSSLLFFYPFSILSTIPLSSLFYSFTLFHTIIQFYIILPLLVYLVSIFYTIALFPIYHFSIFDTIHYYISLLIYPYSIVHTNPRSSFFYSFTLFYNITLFSIYHFLYFTLSTIPFHYTFIHFSYYTLYHSLHYFTLLYYSPFITFLYCTLSSILSYYSFMHFPSSL